VKNAIELLTGVPSCFQHLTPGGDFNTACDLAKDDEVLCEWNCGQHPLFYVAATGNVDVVRSWVASGADVPPVSS
jgi:hypothetical protein